MKLGHKRSEVGSIPRDWVVMCLRDVAQIRTGIAKNTNVSVTNPVLVHYLRVANVQDGFLDLSEMSQIKVSRSDLQRFSVLPGDVLMNEGGDLDKLGRGAIWRGEFNPCIHQNHVFVVRCGPKVEPAFLNIWSGGTAARRYFLVAGKQTTNLASINKTALGELPVIVPPLSEQHSISETLSGVDGLLGGLDRLIAKKRDLKQAAMQQLLTGRTRLPGFQGIWEVRFLRDIVSTPITDGPHLTPKFLPDGVAFLSVNNLVNNKLDFQDLRFVSREDHLEFSRKCKPIRGDILFGKAASVGMVAMIDTDIELNIWSPLALIRVAHKASARFVYYALQASGVQRQVKLLTNSSSQGNIGMREIGLIEVPLPPSDEQTAIAAVLTDMDAELSALEARRDKTAALKQAVMQELLTGRIRLVNREQVEPEAAYA